MLQLFTQQSQMEISHHERPLSPQVSNFSELPNEVAIVAENKLQQFFTELGLKLRSSKERLGSPSRNLSVSTEPSSQPAVTPFSTHAISWEDSRPFSQAVRKELERGR
jgi:hypothetical protein